VETGLQRDDNSYSVKKAAHHGHQKQVRRMSEKRSKEKKKNETWDSTCRRILAGKLFETRQVLNRRNPTHLPPGMKISLGSKED